MISIYTARETVEEALDDWDEDIAFVDQDGTPMLAFVKYVKVPISDDLAVMETYEDPTVRVDDKQPLSVVMSGRRRWQDDMGEVYRAMVAARELERERTERDLDDVRAEFRRDYINAARDRIMVGAGMTGDNATWHRNG